MAKRLAGQLGGGVHVEVIPGVGEALDRPARRFGRQPGRQRRDLVRLVHVDDALGPLDGGSQCVVEDEGQRAEQELERLAVQLRVGEVVTEVAQAAGHRFTRAEHRVGQLCG